MCVVRDSDVNHILFINLVKFTNLIISVDLSMLLYGGLCVCVRRLVGF